jgi:hypothetical protein
VTFSDPTGLDPTTICQSSSGGGCGSGNYTQPFIFEGESGTDIFQGWERTAMQLKGRLGDMFGVETRDAANMSWVEQQALHIGNQLRGIIGTLPNGWDPYAAFRPVLDAADKGLDAYQEITGIDLRLDIDDVQLVLDGLGMIPGLGAVPDLANAAISLCRGKYGEFLLSLGASIPVFGDVAGAGKIISHADEAVDLARSGQKAIAPAAGGGGRTTYEHR